MLNRAKEKDNSDNYNRRNNENQLLLVSPVSNIYKEVLSQWRQNLK